MNLTDIRPRRADCKPIAPEVDLNEAQATAGAQALLPAILDRRRPSPPGWRAWMAWWAS